VAEPLNTTVAPAGTLRVILRGGRVEVHYQIEDTAVTSAHRACGTATVGVDKGYSEVLVDTDGEHHGTELGELLRSRSDALKERNARRAKLRSIANQAARRGRHGKAERLVNAAYTSHVIPRTSFLGKRVGDRLYSPAWGQGRVARGPRRCDPTSWTEPPTPTSACTPRTGG
jgi:hypothetical protein